MKKFHPRSHNNIITHCAISYRIGFSIYVILFIFLHTYVAYYPASGVRDSVIVINALSIDIIWSGYDQEFYSRIRRKRRYNILRATRPF